MEAIKAFCERKLLGYSVNQYIIMFVVFTIFLPYYFSLAAMMGVVIYLIYTRQIKDVIVSTPRGYWALLFCLLSFFVSYFYQNQMGMGQSLGLMLIAVFVMFYRKHLDERLFTFIVDMCCLASLCCFVWGIMEYVSIVERLGYPFNELIVENAPDDRINSTFKNANLYGMMIQFLVMMCLYKILYAKTLRRVIFYTVTILCNLFVLYLSGCRAGWLSFLITIPFMFYLNNRKKVCLVLCLIMALCIVAVLIKPEIFPRFDNIFQYFFDRTDIWKTGLLGFSQAFLFGMGPSGYYLIYERFNGPMTSHAHSVYIDPLLSFGCVGIGLIAYFSWPLVEEIRYLYQHKLNSKQFSLILCFLITVMIHGIFDYTVFWVQTGTIFLLVLNSGCMYNCKKMQAE